MFINTKYATVNIKKTFFDIVQNVFIFHIGWSMAFRKGSPSRKRCWKRRKMGSVNSHSGSSENSVLNSPHCRSKRRPRSCKCVFRCITSNKWSLLNSDKFKEKITSALIKKLIHKNLGRHKIKKRA